MTEMDNPPIDYLEPQWEKSTLVHDWKNHVSEEVRDLWLTLTPSVRAALARQANSQAEQEKWD